MKHTLKDGVDTQAQLIAGLTRKVAKLERAASDASADGAFVAGTHLSMARGHLDMISRLSPQEYIRRANAS